MEQEAKLKMYYLTAIFSVVFSLLGFSYNAWRMEATEDNSNIREASFEVLKALGELEQVVYALHYDHDQHEGSPRKGWVKIGLIEDMSMLISPEVAADAKQLKQTWSKHWTALEKSDAANEAVIAKVEVLREGIKQALLSLE